MQAAPSVCRPRRRSIGDVGGEQHAAAEQMHQLHAPQREGAFSTSSMYDVPGTGSKRYDGMSRKPSDRQEQPLVRHRPSMALSSRSRPTGAEVLLQERQQNRPRLVDRVGIVAGIPSHDIGSA